MSAYRDAPPTALACPRCKKPLPPRDVAECAHGCGTWVAALVAREVLVPADVVPNAVTRWWRRREPCPQCTHKMALCGQEPGLLQGCAVHGYFVDADTIAHTGLARGVDYAAIEAKLDSPEAADERTRLLAAEQERDRERAAIAKREAELHNLSTLAPRPYYEVPPVLTTYREIKKASYADRVRNALVEHYPRDASFVVDEFVRLVDRVAALEARVRELEQAAQQP